MKSILKCLLLVLTAVTCVAAAAKEDDGMIASLQRTYKELSPKGKMATGAAVGFVGSRLALNSVTSIVKIGVGAYITYVLYTCYCCGVVSHNSIPAAPKRSN